MSSELGASAQPFFFFGRQAGAGWLPTAQVAPSGPGVGTWQRLGGSAWLADRVSGQLRGWLTAQAGLSGSKAAFEGQSAASLSKHTAFSL